MSEIETKTGADPRPPDPRRRSPWGAVGGGLVGGLGALLAVSAAGPLLREVKQSLTLPVVGAWVVGGPLFGLATHELGHLIAGRLVGFQFHMFVLGPLRVQRESSGRIGLYLNRDLTSYGGLAGMVPVETAGLARRFAGFVAGGPLMSFGLAALGLGLGYGLPGLPPLGRLGLSWLGASCGLVCLMTVLPLPNGAFLTDGARLLQYWRGGPRAGRDAALLYLIAQSNAEVPPARWDPSAVATVLSPADGSMFEASGRMMA